MLISKNTLTDNSMLSIFDIFSELLNLLLKNNVLSFVVNLRL